MQNLRKLSEVTSPDSVVGGVTPSLHPPQHVCCVKVYVVPVDIDGHRPERSSIMQRTVWLWPHSVAAYTCLSQRSLGCNIPALLAAFNTSFSLLLLLLLLHAAEQRCCRVLGC